MLKEPYLTMHNRKLISQFVTSVIALHIYKLVYKLVLLSTYTFSNHLITGAKKTTGN